MHTIAARSPRLDREVGASASDAGQVDTASLDRDVGASARNVGQADAAPVIREVSESPSNVVRVNTAPLVHEIELLLADVRARTLLLLAPLTETDVREQHDSLMSPIIWDLGHIGAFEELWLLRYAEHPVAGLVSLGEMPGIFNPFEHPRRERGALPLPSINALLAQLAEVREGVLARLPIVAASAEQHPLTREGYVYRMVAQHEAQHGETILQTLQLKLGEPYHPVRRLGPIAAPAAGAIKSFTDGQMVRFPGGDVRIGTDDRRAAYDNERPAHVSHLAPYFINATPVTNGAYLDFMAAGGYRDRAWWSAAGWDWLSKASVQAPKYWYRRGGRRGTDQGGWWSRTMDHAAPVQTREPVVHVCYYEAEAFAAWAGKRLPTEIEWEAAATYDPASGQSRPFPWGDEAATADLANLDQLSFGTAPVWAYARNVSPIGCYGMIGDVWEWTSSDFEAYPGFDSFPYKEYSEAFFGPESKVLRGGSWATRGLVARSTFRNWDFPIRRQIFSGFRCARDA